MKLSQWELGELSAESDKRLAQHFLETEDVASLASGSATLVLGRKGSGKTALFRELETVLDKRDITAGVVRLTPDAYAWSAFRDFKRAGVPLQHAASVAWQMTFLVELASALVEGVATLRLGAEASRDVEGLRRFLLENFGSTRPTLNANRTRRLSRLDLSVLGVGAGVTLDADAARDEDTLTPTALQAMKDKVARPLLESSWLVAIDRVDEVWDGSDETRDLIIGLVVAVKALNDDFSWSSGQAGAEVHGARFVCFLRTDIYDVLDYDDRDKHRSQELRLLWKQEELRQLVEKRLPSGRVLGDVFESDAKGAGGRLRYGSFSFVVRQTFFRPREVLQFLLACQAKAPNEERVTDSLVRGVLPLYSGTKLDDLKQEYKKSNPWLGDLFEALRGRANKYESVDALTETLVTRAGGSLVSGAGGARAIALFLFDIGVLGQQQQRVGGVRYRHEAPELGLVHDAPVWIHPSLVPALDLKEPRPEPAAGATEDSLEAEG